MIKVNKVILKKYDLQEGKKIHYLHVLDFSTYHNSFAGNDIFRTILILESCRLRPWCEKSTRFFWGNMILSIATNYYQTRFFVFWQYQDSESKVLFLRVRLIIRKWRLIFNEENQTPIFKEKTVLMQFNIWTFWLFFKIPTHWKRRRLWFLMGL